MDTLTHNYGSSSSESDSDDEGKKTSPAAKKAKVSSEEILHLQPSTSKEFSSIKMVNCVPYNLLP
jgi:hypothetical protein